MVQSFGGTIRLLEHFRRSDVLLRVGLALAAAVGLGYGLLRPEPVPAGFLYANGQLEATEVRVAASQRSRRSTTVVI